jgi:hypothetical protein
LKDAGMVFFVHNTIIYEGTESMFWYKYHQEAVYCIEGEGEMLFSLIPQTISLCFNRQQQYHSIFTISKKPNYNFVDVPCLFKIKKKQLLFT